MAATTTDLTEICNDDGFVYKRRKRSTPPPQPSKPPSSSPSSAERRKRRRTRKKESLVNIRRRYMSEMEQWDRFSTALQDLLVVVPASQSPNPRPSTPGPVPDPQATAGVPIDEILLQVEAQEAVIDRLAGICDVVDWICDSREEAVLQSLIDLPIWVASPRALLASLSE